MIERQRRRRRARIEEPHRLRVVGGTRLSTRTRDVYDSYRLSARIAIGPRIDAEQCANFDIKRNFLARLANRRLFDGLAEINEAAGNRPPVRKILALDKNHLVA